MEVGAIILAGGKSSRMGTDKGLLLFENKPMVMHLVETVKKITKHILIIANDSRYKSFGIPVYEDLIKNAGPLAGIYTGLYHTPFEKNIVLSCDTPLVKVDLLQILIDNCENCQATIPIKDDKTHQLIGIYSKSCLPIIQNEIDKKRLRIKDVLSKIDLKTIDANQIHFQEFLNFNTPEELKQYYEN
ncbi:MAG: molybdenum cofactor guanylyltransferase [Flavobacteriales bacterium]|nr:molybdenum cofactor guanylyltransferase [Flavobacteriales bacterium]